jgi:hypothetical protein
MKTFCIVYGFAEGPITAKKLIKLLEKKGLQLSQSKNADLIIAHSGGCFLVPNDCKASNIILVNPTIWPNRSLFNSFMARKDKIISLTSLWYAFAKPTANLQMLRRRKLENLPIDSVRNVIIIRNTNDTYFSPEIMNMLVDKDVDAKVVAGDHDAIWSKPTIIEDLLNQASLYQKV